MSAISLQGNAGGTGTLTIAAPSTNTNRTLTLPDNTGTLISTGSTFAGTGPAFSAYPNANQTIANSVYTQIQNNTEEFDTASCYNNTGSTVGGIPAYSFLPNVAGYYQVCVGVYSSSSTTTTGVSIYKNAAAHKSAAYTATNSSAVVTALVYLNGSTDYVSAYAYLTAVTPVITGTSVLTFFQAAMVRAA
jgi:hypothetical protein